MKGLELGGLNAQIAIMLIVAAVVVVGVAVLFAPQPASPIAPSEPVSPPPIIIPTGPGPVITPEMNFTTTAVCGIGKPCETGECIDAGSGPQCLEDPCALCAEGQQCIILESYPGQLRCVKPDEQAPADDTIVTASLENLPVTRDGNTISFETSYDICEDNAEEWSCLTEEGTTQCTLTGVNAPAETPKSITVTCFNHAAPLNRHELTGAIA